MRMSFHGLALFCLVYLVATATPGPGIAAIVARVLSRGTRGLPAFIAGFVIGDLIWFTLAATGMAVLAQTMHQAFVALRYLGALYLLLLAYRMWMSPPVPFGENLDESQDERPARLLAAGLALTLGNPKVMVFFLALLPTVIDLREIGLRSYLQVAVAMLVILSGVLSTYSVVAMRARRLLRDARAVRWLNRGSGGVMVGAAVIVATQ
jgi:threonine/homoserine/homoserine lactone efflux protein